MKKISKNIIFYIITIVAATLSSCSDSLFEDGGQNDGANIRLAADIEQLSVMRVNDSGFCDGDMMGVYVVDYEGGKPGTLKPSGNRGDNVRYTFDESANKWTGAYDLYWKDKHTPIDVYGYYPFAAPESIDDYQFEVQKDQSKPSADGEMGGYEASDFLWGKVADVAPTTSVIRLPLSHRMSNARVTLVQGSGFTAEEWANTEKIVLVPNVARKASINLAEGTISVAGDVENTATIPSRTGNEWRAIVVPQTVSAGTTLFSITIGGTPFKFSKPAAFEYKAGYMMNFSIKVDKQEVSGQYKLTLVSASISEWESDLVSHNATAKEYIVVNSTPGKLKDAIAAIGKDYEKVKNLKITGEINSEDFYFMRDHMPKLSALNLKEVRIKASCKPGEGEEGYDDQIPGSAFYSREGDGNESLNRIILPDHLRAIGGNAFYDCRYLTGSLVIPEGVTEIRRGAFNGCIGLNGTLSLPSTLKKLGNNWNSDSADESTDYYGGVFQGCYNLTGNLVLPNNLELIRGYCFSGCSGLYGELRLPEKLKHLGVCAFQGCHGLTGSLTIPQGISTVPAEAFNECGFNGTLTLHDGTTNIGRTAFNNCHFKGELRLPRNLKAIADHAFCNNDFSGELKLPSEVTHIGNSAFANNWRITGILNLPDGIESIGEDAFTGCKMLEGVIFPESMETIRQRAFNNCFGIGSIECRGTMPPRIESGAFDGVSKENFTVEVPSSAVAHYQAAQGWCDFKRIAAHHELTCSPSVACALSTEHKQTITVNAEGEWEVASKPDWCEVSPMSGNKKTNVTITIKATAKSSGSKRDGKVVFRLKDKDYTHECSVSQYGYQYGEDEWVTLQKATRGNRGGINIVLLGDGYDANEIASGEYLKVMNQEMEYFFGIEPYKTYRQYFNVYTAMPLSTESGIGSVNTIRYNRFGTTFTGGSGLKAEYDEIFSYALGAPTVTKDNLCQTLIIVVPNSTDYGGITQMWADGSAISFCPLSTYGYPLDSRGVVQHEAGGHGFGKLGEEAICHNAFIDACGCSCCGHVDELNTAKSYGWYDNLSLSGKIHGVGWSHLISDSRYSDIVDVYEGGFMHSRGVYRSEQNSCMNNDIPYYNTISRESIVKRIKRYAGETFSFEDFVKHDKRDVGVAQSPARVSAWGRASQRSATTYQHRPVIRRGSPLRMAKVRRHR